MGYLEFWREGKLSPSEIDEKGNYMDYKAIRIGGSRLAFPRGSVSPLFKMMFTGFEPGTFALWG